MTADAFLAKLARVRPSGQDGDAWTAACPAHEDRESSLSVKATGERLLLKCFAGCAVPAIVHALGLTIHDLFLPAWSVS